jgi:HK97 family phage major capsid protein
MEILSTLQTELKGFIAKSQDEQKALGSAHEETTKAIVELTSKINDIDKRMIESAKRAETKSLADTLKENDNLQKLVRGEATKCRFEISGKHALEIMERKTTITSAAVGFPTSGVMPEERGSLVLEARRALRIADIIPRRATTLGKLYWPKVNASMSNASPQGAQGTAKLENAETFTTANAEVQTIATWIPASNQVLADWSELAGVLNNALAYYVAKEIDEQILSGDGTGYNLNGLTTQAQSFDTALLPSAANGYTYIDTVASAFQQVDADDELPSDFVVLSTTDVWSILKTKDGDKRYIIGDPRAQGPFTLWGRTVVPSNSMTVGYFLAGSASSAAAEIRDRMGVTIDISTEHSDYFTKNLVAIRAEARLALCVYRPNAFVYGALAASPA